MTAPRNTLMIYTRHLLGRYGRTGIWWAVVIAFYLSMLIIVYPTFVESGTLDLDRFPAFMVEALDIPDMTQPTEFLQQQVFGNLPLILPFFLIMAFAGAIAGAEDRGALDILLGNPIPRRNVVLAHWIAVTIVLIGIVAFVGVAMWTVAQIMGLDFTAGAALRGVTNLLPICLTFGTLALALSAKMRNSGAVIGIVFALIFLMYLMEILSNLVPSLDWLGRFSAFRYYGRAMTEGFPWASAIGLTGITLVLLLVAIRLFEKRDVYT
jgi:ABC-2 type transport system permease protein